MKRAQHGEAIGIVGAIETEVRRLAATGIEFQPDDVLPNLSSRRAIGPVFARLAKAGVITCTGATNSTRPERHGALTRTWRGTGTAGDVR